MSILLLFQLLVQFAIGGARSELVCPDSIKKSIWNHGSGDNTDLHQIYKTLTKCATVENTSLRTLHLGIKQSGCVLGMDDEWNFDFRPGDRFPSLHELHLNGYRFGNVPKFRYRQKDFQDLLYQFWQWIADYTGISIFRPTPEIGGRDTDDANLEQWKAAMDWTELRDLDLDTVDSIILRSLYGQLPALKSLKLGLLRSQSCLATNVTDFVTQLDPLSRLSLRGHTEAIELAQILDRHGTSLEMLEIHEWEGDHFLRPTLSRHDLNQIQQKCSSLSKLSLDINRNGTWPYEVLDDLAENQNLSSLKIYFELGMNMHQERDYYSPYHPLNKTKDFRQPLVNTSSSLILFNRLRSLKQGVELKHLTIVVGDSDREYSHMMRMPAWGETLAETYDCSVLESSGARKVEGEALCVERLGGTDRNHWQNSFDEVEDVAFKEELRQLQAESEL